MSPTPVTYSLPGQPASYSWEATDEEVSARYGIAPDRIVRFDLNTSPVPPDLAARLLARGKFETPLSEYPPSDYRRLAAAAAGRYGVAPDEVLVGAGADEILDIIGKAYLGPGLSAVLPIPTYAMYRVITEQRGARLIAVGRRGPEDGYALDLAATRLAARDAAIVWLCSPNNPTGLAEPDGAIERLLSDINDDARADDRTAPLVVLDEAYAEFIGRSLLGLRVDHPNLIVVRTASKAYALAGLRVGFGLARPEVIARLNPYRPPGSVSTVSVTIVTEALRDPGAFAANVDRVVTERERLTTALRQLGWTVRPSVTNFVLVAFEGPGRASDVAVGLLRHGLVPRTFPAGHPLADHLRLTVRDGTDNDRLIAAARTLSPGGAP
ncbi:MAG: histidinol-phosphate transaminase [Candidatus Limnocylindrales bacterium]